MTVRRTAFVATLLSILVGAFALTSSGAPAPTRESPSHHLKRGFRNLNAEYAYPMAERAKKFVRRIGEKWPARGAAPAVLRNDGAAVRANGYAPSITWVGHSTFLVQLDGLNILTDPHWGQRASPVGFAGPRRLVDPGMRFEDLPPIHAVVISHDHYDHLDLPTIGRIARDHRATFFVPLGVKPLLTDVGAQNVIELDWWESRKIGALTFVCTPAQHSSGRGLHDQNLRLWSSWVILGKTKRFFFAGDTGYYAGLKEIGTRFGPFDLAAIPIGGYSSYHARHPNHVNPEEAIQLFEDVGARMMAPMHWGTFELNREPFREPPDRLLKEALRRGVEDRIALLSHGQTIHW